MPADPAAAREALARVFHEPSRLAIVSALCAAAGPAGFVELRDRCRLTDGNLNRHLKALEDEGIVRLRKRAAAGRPQTTVELTPRGLARFHDYLEALGAVLASARRALGREPRAAPALARPAPA